MTPFKKIEVNGIFHVTQWDVVKYSTIDEKKANQLIKRLRDNWRKDNNEMRSTDDIVNEFKDEQYTNIQPIKANLLK